MLDSNIMDDNDNAFLVLEPQSEGQNPWAPDHTPSLPLRTSSLKHDRPNFLIITADSMCDQSFHIVFVG